MQSFLEEVVQKVWQKYDAMEHLVFVLPSKRAGTFLRNAIAETTDRTLFSPEIYSIESFIEKISGLAYANHTQQLFALYNTYLKTKKGEKDSFLDFSKWGSMLLQDFNEIDRYLIDTQKLFSNLSAIQEISIWSADAEKTKMMEDYLKFWYSLEPIYHHFNNALLEQGLGHQGLVYRRARELLTDYLKESSKKTHIFVGFNALNKAESQIIQKILLTSEAEIYWDIDSYFLNDPIHDAGYFIRQHQKEWKFFEQNAIKGVSANYLSKKDIKIIGMPKNVSQAKYVGNLLLQMIVEHPESLKKTAVVLGDEALLNPILNSVPEEINGVNITMGYPLGKTPLAGMFSQFMNLYINREARDWFYKDIISFLLHPYVHKLLKVDDANLATLIINDIKHKNWAYVDTGKIASTKGNNVLSLLFFDENITPKGFVKKCLEVINQLKIKFQKIENSLALEYLYRFNTLFNQILDLVEKHSFIVDIKSLHSLYKELLSSETLDFQGEPLQGLQIMGMLESRNLDFETVILTSVNEGILPSGKSNNSFIPFDLKMHMGLPTYKEKDAVYTYHFYRLLQRAKNIYILYNTEPDVLEGGEKSRLIFQMLTDEKQREQITEITAAPVMEPTGKTLQCIAKDDHLMQLIREHAIDGFSPTSLSNYIRNPIDFYKKTLLRINDILEVEETLAANTLGTIVHDTLEDLYTPFVGKYLSGEGLKKLKSNIKGTVLYHFGKSYSDGDISTGKNLIAFNVVVRYVHNFIDLEIEEVKKHEIKILGLEKKMSMVLDLPEIGFPITLKGKLDRIDTKDGITRIIDYKTGKVDSKHVEVVNWDEIISEYDYSKAFQLLCYTLLFSSENPIAEIRAGIISFKNLNAGLLSFATKEKKGSRIKDVAINNETLEIFSRQLKQLLMEICNPDIPFLEKEV